MTHNTLRTAVLEAIAQLTGCSSEGISDTDDLVDDLGVDSMIAVNLIVAIEDRLGALLPDGYESNLADVRSVGILVERLECAFMAINDDQTERSTDGGRAP